jgi:hypothetical protein
MRAGGKPIVTLERLESGNYQVTARWVMSGGAMEEVVHLSSTLRGAISYVGRYDQVLADRLRRAHAHDIDDAIEELREMAK